MAVLYHTDQLSIICELKQLLLILNLSVINGTTFKNSINVNYI